MRKLHDQISKELLQKLLEPFGQVEVEHEVSHDAQKIDISFIRLHVEQPSAHPSQRFLSSVLSDWSLVEACSEAPRMRQWRSYIRKQYAWGHHLQRKGKTNEFPWLWVLAAGKPRTAIEGFGLSGANSDVPGIYTSKAPALCLGLVVLSELPRTRETLLLRLLSKGKALKEAMEEVSELPEDLWVAETGLELMMRYPLPADKLETEDLDPWGKEFVMRAAEILKKERQEGIQEGIKEGIREGMLKERRNAIETFARFRFGAATADQCASSIADMNDLDELAAVMEAVATAESVDQLVEHLEGLLDR